MKKILLPFGFCLFLLQVCPFYAVASERIQDASLNLSLGYRVDQLDWNIARTASGGSPNVLSELAWENLGIWQLDLDGRAELTNSYFSNATTILKAEVAYGWIVTGENQDSDYAGDNRSLEWSRSNNRANEGNIFDISGAVGLKFALFENRLSLAPLIGYAFNRQELSLTDGVQTVSNQANYDLLTLPPVNFPPGGPAPLGPFAGLDSRYDANWWGPWLGFDVEVAFSPKLNFAAGLEYHWIDYFADADWNLRSDFAHPVSFEHEADGAGLVLNVAADYLLDHNWSLIFSGRYRNWQTDAGSDRTFFSSGSVGLQRLNEVNWKSSALMVGCRYRF